MFFQNSINFYCAYRFLGCSLREGQQQCVEQRKFLVYYIEEYSPYEVSPSLETVLFRNALSQNGLISSEGLSNELEFGALDRFNLSKLLNSEVFL